MNTRDLADTLVLELDMGNRTFRLLRHYTLVELWELILPHFGRPVMLTLSKGTARACYIGGEG